MTNIEQKALALALEVRADDKYRVCKEPTVYFALWEALCRAIERHEAFRQEVSDAVQAYLAHTRPWPDNSLRRFIIAKPDPLAEAIKDADDMVRVPDAPSYPEAIRAALAKRGGKIVFDD